MKQVSENPNITLQEAEEHYQLSSENYTIESGESFFSYYQFSCIRKIYSNDCIGLIEAVFSKEIFFFLYCHNEGNT